MLTFFLPSMQKLMNETSSKLINYLKGGEKVDLHSQVLTQDYEQATNLHHHCYRCLGNTRVAFVQGKIEIADKWLADYLKNKSELNQLLEKKKRYDRKLELVRAMNEKGVNIEVIIKASFIDLKI